jgi:hypothetical protein
MKKVAESIWRDLLPVSPVFTTARVAKLSGTSISNASRDLSGLAKQGLITRVRRGLWAVTDHPDFSPYAVVPFLFAESKSGYVSLLTAMNLHGMVEQIPHRVHVMTTSQRPTLKTPMATYDFHQLKSSLFGGFSPYRKTGSFEIASPEKTLFDTLYLSVRRGRRFSHLPEVHLGRNFSEAEVLRWIGRIEHSRLRTAVRSRWARLLSAQERLQPT